MTGFGIPLGATLIGLGLLLWALRTKTQKAADIIAGAVGAGIAVFWREALGFGNISILMDAAWVIGGVLIAFGVAKLVRAKQ